MLNPGEWLEEGLLTLAFHAEGLRVKLSHILNHIDMLYFLDSEMHLFSLNSSVIGVNLTFSGF
jgi:hypothetical protein